MTVIAISGSPTPGSRTRHLLSHLLSLVGQQGRETHLLSLSTLPADALIAADITAPDIARSLAQVENARVVIVGTPIYKASCSGLLKVFLDLLPQDELDGKIVLPIATGGSKAHLLALDYALRPVLQSLGAGVVLPSVFALDQEVVRRADNTVSLDPALDARVQSAADLVGHFADRLFVPRPAAGAADRVAV